MSRVGKLQFLFFMVVFLGWAGFAYASVPIKDVKAGAYAGYNVLFVSFDALQSAHMSCLGHFRKTTPTIDRFASEGYLFRNAIAQSSWTVPSTMSYMTSLYPSQHKMVNKYSTYAENKKVLSNLKALSPDVITLADILKEQGYATGGFTGDTGGEVRIWQRL